MRRWVQPSRELHEKVKKAVISRNKNKAKK